MHMYNNAYQKCIYKIAILSNVSYDKKIHNGTKGTGIKYGSDDGA